MSERNYLKTCQACGQPFGTSRVDARYCSAACRKRAERIRRATKEHCDRAAKGLVPMDDLTAAVIATLPK